MTVHHPIFLRIRKCTAFMAMLVVAYLTAATTCLTTFHNRHTVFHTTLPADRSSRDLSLLIESESSISDVSLTPSSEATLSVADENGVFTTFSGSLMGLCPADDCMHLTLRLERNKIPSDLDVDITVSVTTANRCGGGEEERPLVVELEFGELN